MGPATVQVRAVCRGRLWAHRLGLGVALVLDMGWWVLWLGVVGTSSPGGGLRLLWLHGLTCPLWLAPQDPRLCLALFLRSGALHLCLMVVPHGVLLQVAPPPPELALFPRLDLCLL